MAELEQSFHCEFMSADWKFIHSACAILGLSWLSSELHWLSSIGIVSGVEALNFGFSWVGTVWSSGN